MKYGFIVEGFNDEFKLKAVLPHVHVVVTKGTRLNNRVRMDIRSALEKCDAVFLLTDPDDAGKIIAEKLQKEFPMLERIELDVKECKCVRNNRLKIGMEHADKHYLAGVLQKYVTE